jgi:hypothetical protein
VIEFRKLLLCFVWTCFATSTTLFVLIAILVLQGKT